MAYNYIFPTCIWYDNQIELAEQLLPVARQYLNDSGKTFTDNNNHVSTYREASVSQQLKRDPKVKPLLDLLIYQSKEYIKKQNVNLDPIKDKLENLDNLYIFFNRIGKTASHIMHAHPNSILSGCFYLNCNEKDSPLIISDPRPYMNYVFYEQKLYDDTNINTLCPDFIIPVKTGLIMLWPSWLQHMVPEQKVDSDRITIVFNIGHW